MLSLSVEECRSTFGFMVGIWVKKKGIFPNLMWMAKNLDS